jgi:hypothetical protein
MTAQRYQFKETTGNRATILDTHTGDYVFPKYRGVPALSFEWPNRSQAHAVCLRLNHPTTTVYPDAHAYALA